ncbi:hypothetical protein D082_12920 [Synechocystis sp. PCC 6714]|nr:hypothetical protein D082_12920 [Synechocystis sp. PCC 6714]
MTLDLANIAMVISTMGAKEHGQGIIPVDERDFPKATITHISTHSPMALCDNG